MRSMTGDPISYEFCSSMSASGLRVYGKRFCSSFYRFVPPNIPLHIYSEDEEVGKDLGPDYRDFERRYGHLSFARPSKDGPVRTYREEFLKFSKKVFSVTDVFISPVNKDWRIWIDADVEITKDLDGKFFEETCKPGYVASYLGRKAWSHSECGFVAYNLREGGLQFLRKFRRMYMDGLIFGLNEIHDSYIWDFVRLGMERTGHKFLNLSPDAEGLDAWPHSILGEYAKHNKGPLAKQREYGEVV